MLWGTAELVRFACKKYVKRTSPDREGVAYPICKQERLYFKHMQDATTQKADEDKDQKPQDLLAQAKEVLKMNDRGNYTQPAHGLYPHQWLWDSCFIAIGQRHIDVERAKAEILSLLRGQWHNGMMPNIIFRDEPQYRTDRNIWRSWLNPYAPNDITTTGITQPPVLAEAVVQMGKKLAWPERRSWYAMVYPALLAYHEWLYKERDPHGEGLVLQIHPWETGLDNTPPWMNEMHEHLTAVLDTPYRKDPVRQGYQPVPARHQARRCQPALLYRRRADATGYPAPPAPQGLRHQPHPEPFVVRHRRPVVQLHLHQGQHPP